MGEKTICGGVCVLAGLLVNACSTSTQKPLPLPDPCNAFDVAMTTMPGFTGFVGEASWTGHEYIVPISDGELVALSGHDGTMTASFAPPPGYRFQGLGSPVAWSGQYLGVVVVDTQLVFARYDTLGAIVGIVDLPQGGGWATLRWVGDRYLVVAEDANNSLVFQEIAEDGSVGALARFDYHNFGGIAFNQINAVAATPTTYAVLVSYNNTGGNLLLVDRATEQMTVLDTAVAALAAGPDGRFALDYGTSFFLVAADGTRTPASGSTFPITYLLSSPTGYLDLVSDQQSTAVSAVELDAAGQPGSPLQIVADPAGVAAGTPYDAHFLQHCNTE